MKVLAAETSCDETGIAVVEGSARHPDTGGIDFEFKTLRAALLSQAHLHAEYGGVYPNLAKREHQKNLPLLFREFEKDEVDAIAVTYGPGLEPALWQGITFAQDLAKKWQRPLIPINHMEAHLISSLAQEGRLENIKLPVLALLVSGGHTEFVLIKAWIEYEVIGETLDDAVGECFDKVARMLGLPYPGGPEISKLAEKHRLQEESSRKGPRVSPPVPFLRGRERGPDHLLKDTSFRLPRPMLTSKNCDVSFSGLKTAALYALRGKKLTEKERAAFAREFEDAVTEVFVAKTRRALEETGTQTFVIGGGVAAHKHLRESLQNLITKEFPDVEFRLPELSITGDNAVMIAQTALARLLSGKQKENGAEIRAVGNLSIAA